MKLKVIQSSFILVLWVLWSGLVATAQNNYPTANDPYINDYAQVIEPQDAQNIKTMLADLQQQAHVEAIVLTINSIHDYPTGDPTLEAFATHLFNTWGIGDAATNKGVLILVAVKDRKVRIELGKGYQAQDNSMAEEIITEHMLPAFKQNQYSRGIFQGVRALTGQLTGHWPPNAGENFPAAPISSTVLAALFAVMAMLLTFLPFCVGGIFIFIFWMIVLSIIRAVITGDWGQGGSIRRTTSESSSDSSSWSSGSWSDSGSSWSSSDSGSSSSDSGGSSDGGGSSGDW